MGNLVSGHKNPRCLWTACVLALVSSFKNKQLTTTWYASHRATITDHDRAVLSLKAQRKKLEDQSKLVGVARLRSNMHSVGRAVYGPRLLCHLLGLHTTPSSCSAQELVS